MTDYIAPIVPLDATLLTPSLGAVFGLPGFGSAPLNQFGPNPLPPSFHSNPSALQQQQPSLAGQAVKPMARWGGAAKEELQRSNQTLEPPGLALFSQLQQQKQQQQLLPIAPIDTGEAHRGGGALQAFQRWAGSAEPSGMERGGQAHAHASRTQTYS
jgi:hypothetical protein